MKYTLKTKINQTQDIHRNYRYNKTNPKSCKSVQSSSEYP